MGGTAFTIDDRTTKYKLLRERRNEVRFSRGSTSSIEDIDDKLFGDKFGTCKSKIGVSGVDCEIPKILTNEIIETITTQCSKNTDKLERKNDGKIHVTKRNIATRDDTDTCTKIGLKEYILTKTHKDWDDAWENFVQGVVSVSENDGVCKIHKSLGGVTVAGFTVSGVDVAAYSFSCAQSPDLCDCVSGVGTGSISDTQYFVNQYMGIYLGIFRNDGDEASYEICKID